jgi:hypothetical protein
MKNTNATAKLRNGTKSTVDLVFQNLSKDWFELPRINYKYNGKKYKYTYGIGSTVKVNYAVPIVNKVSAFNK